MCKLMLRVPLLLHAGAASQLFPLLAAGLVRRGLKGPRGWVAAWCGVLVVGDMVQLALGLRDVNNHWVPYVTIPVAGVIILLALAKWQERQIPRLTFQVAVPLFLVTWGLLALFVENPGTFSTAADPVYSLLGLGAAVYTLVSRSADEPEPLARQDWFWICGGLALYFGTASTLGPVAAFLLNEHPVLVIRAYEAKSATDVLAFLAIAKGITCQPSPPQASGASSSPA